MDFFGGRGGGFLGTPGTMISQGLLDLCISQVSMCNQSVFWLGDRLQEVVAYGKID